MPRLVKRGMRVDIVDDPPHRAPTFNRPPAQPTFNDSDTPTFNDNGPSGYSDSGPRAQPYNGPQAQAVDPVAEGRRVAYLNNVLNQIQNEIQRNAAASIERAKNLVRLIPQRVHVTPNESQDLARKVAALDAALVALREAIYGATPPTWVG